jgi:hypothetical protein
MTTHDLQRKRFTVSPPTLLAQHEAFATSTTFESLDLNTSLPSKIQLPNHPLSIPLDPPTSTVCTLTLIVFFTADVPFALVSKQNLQNFHLRNNLPQNQQPLTDTLMVSEVNGPGGLRGWIDNLKIGLARVFSLR